MEHKQEKNQFTKVFGIFLGMVVLFTFFSKSIYNYQLPVVSVTYPKEGELNFSIQETTEIFYSQTENIYADIDGRIKEILVQDGDEVQKGQCLVQMESAGKKKEIIAEHDGIITSIGVKKGMYVSSMQNIVLYSIAEKSEEWMAAVFVTEEQLEYVDLESSVTVQIEEIGERLTGTVKSIVSYAGQGKTGYQVSVAFVLDNPELAGKKADITIKKKSEGYETLIPAATLRKDAVGYYVLVLKEDDSVLGNGYAVHRMSVDLLDSDTTYCAVRGLPMDEIVIISATSEIADGSKVYYEGER